MERKAQFGTSHGLFPASSRLSTGTCAGCNMHLFHPSSNIYRSSVQWRSFCARAKAPRWTTRLLWMERTGWLPFDLYGLRIGFLPNGTIHNSQWAAAWIWLELLWRLSSAFFMAHTPWRLSRRRIRLENEIISKKNLKRMHFPWKMVMERSDFLHEKYFSWVSAEFRGKSSTFTHATPVSPKSCLPWIKRRNHTAFEFSNVKCANKRKVAAGEIGKSNRGAERKVEWWFDIAYCEAVPAIISVSETLNEVKCDHRLITLKWPIG